MSLQHAVPLEIRINPDGVSKTLTLDISKEYGFVFGPPALNGFAIGFALINPEAIPDDVLVDFAVPAVNVKASIVGKLLTLQFNEPPTNILTVAVSLLFNSK
jgi:hypothetical protein